MDKDQKITREQFNKIVSMLEPILLPPENQQRGMDPEPEPVDCVALLAFITAAQTIYNRDCAIV